MFLIQNRHLTQDDQGDVTQLPETENHDGVAAPRLQDLGYANGC